MRRFAQLSLPRKVTALALGASLVVVLVFSTIFILRERVSARETGRETLHVRARVIGENFAVALDFNSPRPVQDALNQLEEDPGMLGAAAYDSTGKLIASYRRKDRPQFTPPPAPPTEDHFVGDVLHLTRPIPVGERVIGTIYFERDMIELQAHFSRTLVNLSLAALAATALGFLVSSALQRIVSQPILDLARTSHSVAISHDFAIRAVKASPDEIGELVDSFNRMLEQIQVRDEALAQARDELELRVVERTRQLTDALAKLQAEIHDRENAQEALRQSQKLQAVGQLAAGVAHDFNNLLTVIKGNTSLLEFNGQLSAEDHGFIKELHEACGRAAGLVHQLLAFSRKQIIQLKSLDLNELVAGDAKMLNRLLGEQIVLQCTFATTPVMVRADRGMMDQIIVNLAVNAHDAMPGGGRLQISTGFATVDAARQAKNAEARPGEFCTLTVTDTGCGMDAATQARIFEPFFTTKEVGQGTGLGLATVYGIIKQHEGWIECTSAPGVGTTFQVFLPLLPTSAIAPSTPVEDETAVRGTETLLLVEDEAAVREINRRALARLGYHVLVAGSGPEALPIWRTHRGEVSLLVTDIVMPGGMSGLELAERIHQDQATLPVIYTSGYSTDLFEGKAVLHIGQNYLPKPYSLPALAKAVRAALDGRGGAGK